MREGLSYVRRNHYLLLLIGASLGVVMLGFPYMAFLPSVADGMFDVGAGGYGLMSAVTSIGAVGAALVAARRGARADLWKRLVIAGMCFGVGVVLLGLSPAFPVTLVILVGIGASSLLFQTANQSLLLMLSDFEYHGRLARPRHARLQRLRHRGAAARDPRRRDRLASDARDHGRRVRRDRVRRRAARAASTPCCASRATSASSFVSQSTPTIAEIHASASRLPSMRWTVIQVKTESSPVSRSRPRLVARVQILSPTTTSSSTVVTALCRMRWYCTSFCLYAARRDDLRAGRRVADVRVGEQLVDRVEVALAPHPIPPALEECLRGGFVHGGTLLLPLPFAGRNLVT